ncbi:hypothetical protein J437_LFUL019612 [Ladona fulva]|uniref:Uncharacterized protein n=1 Tax=Ladona fulva TaxID=123851 RepID=A0A8K0KSI9_LADFU|nr:hypothetical protein J437_LFUL019612 [Ladona fulva]
MSNKQSFQAKIAMFEAKYYNIKAIMATVILAEGSGSNKLGLTSPTHVSGAGMSRIALPKLNLVEFNGDLQAWQSFYDIFKASIHNSIEISVEKFMHLRSCIKGEPLSLVSSLPLAGANYSVAWDTLKSRYNQPSFLMNAYLEALLGLRLVEQAPEQLRMFTTLLIEYMDALSALGYQVEDWSFKGLSKNDRFPVAKDKRLCLSCLQSGHSVKTCRRQNPCQHCPFKHHSLLHFTPRDQDSPQTAVGVAHGKLAVIFEPTPKGEPIEVEALEIENIARCPKMEVQKQWPHISNLILADPLYYQPESIDIMLGAE